MLVLMICALVGMALSAVAAAANHDWDAVMGWVCGLLWCGMYMAAYRKKWHG